MFSRKRCTGRITAVTLSEALAGVLCRLLIAGLPRLPRPRVVRSLPRRNAVCSGGDIGGDFHRESTLASLLLERRRILENDQYLTVVVLAGETRE